MSTETTMVPLSPQMARAQADLYAAMKERAEAAEKEVERLRGAISWIEPPFIDVNTSEAELRQRIGFVIADAKRDALLPDNGHG